MLKGTSLRDILINVNKLEERRCSFHTFQLCEGGVGQISIQRCIFNHNAYAQQSAEHNSPLLLFSKGIPRLPKCNSSFCKETNVTDANSMNAGVYLNRSVLKNSALSTCTPSAASHTPSFTSTSSCSWSCLCWNSVKLFISQSILSLKKKHDAFGWLKEEGRDMVITGTIYSFKADFPFTFPNSQQEQQENANNDKHFVSPLVSLLFLPPDTFLPVSASKSQVFWYFTDVSEAWFHACRPREAKQYWEVSFWTV